MSLQNPLIRFVLDGATAFAILIIKPDRCGRDRVLRLEGILTKLVLPLYAIYHKFIGGTESAIYNLIKGLSQVPETDVELYYSNAKRLAPEFVQWTDTVPNIARIMTRPVASWKNIRFFEELKFSFIGIDADMILYPNYFCPPTRTKAGAKLATILYDIQYKSLPQYHSRKRRAWLDVYLKLLFKTADHIYLLSEFERQKVEQYFGQQAADRCIVGYVAIDWSRFEPSPDQQSKQSLPGKPYILSVCHPYPHKNVTTLFKAFGELSVRNKDIDLVLIGRASDENVFFCQNNLSEPAAKRVRFVGFVSDAELGEWYRNASVFASPSLYEGFGMPAVESMGLGVKTIVSDAGAMREVTLNKAEYIRNPLNAEEWVDSLERAIAAPGLSPHVIAEIRARYNPLLVAQNYLQPLRK